ncbi:MAG: hypothetical protein J5747_04185 [Spirochaetaceae bacterium]|nr:hypothetical protein [Spirochaetaceae bacterium]
MNKSSKIFSPVLQIIIATSILFGHIIFGFILFPLQNSITKGDTEDILVSGIAGVEKSLAMANSAINAPEYAYLFTEYDSVGKDGGFIIADKLHDIKSGKKVESCRTLEDAGIDINKYEPLTISQTEIFGNDCYFAYLREESYVIVAYIPVEVQKSQRTLNVFAALGTSLIIFIALFFLVPLLVQFLSRFSWFPPVSAWNSSGERTSSFDEPLDESDDAVSYETAILDDESDYAYDEDTSDSTFDADMLPKEEVISDDYESVSAESDAIAESSAETGGNSPDTDGMAEYVEKMQELKKTAYKLGEEKLFKMAAYLEKCGMAILAGSKDADKFMAEIDSKTPVALKYYASCLPPQELEKQMAAMAEQNAGGPSEPIETSVKAASDPVTEPEPEQKVDVSPAEIFAALEALYAGAASTDANAVNTQISALSHINLPRKLNAVFPELSAAASQSDFTRIKAVIDSLRTGSRAS